MLEQAAVSRGCHRFAVPCPAPVGELLDGEHACEAGAAPGGTEPLAEASCGGAELGHMDFRLHVTERGRMPLR